MAIIFCSHQVPSKAVDEDTGYEKGKSGKRASVYYENYPVKSPWHGWSVIHQMKRQVNIVLYDFTGSINN